MLGEYHKQLDDGLSNLVKDLAKKHFKELSTKGGE
jgi:hypothetical protein